MNIITIRNVLLALQIFSKYITWANHNGNKMTREEDDSDEIIRGNDFLTQMFDKMLDYNPFFKSKSNKTKKLKFLRDGVFLDGWNLYKHLNNKVYESQRIEDKRKSIFFNNLKKIKRHNLDSSKTFKMGINMFADITTKEFISQNSIGKCNDKNFLPVVHDDGELRKHHKPPKNLPKEYDLRNFGYNSGVKNQHECGGCYAMSALTILEAHIANRTNKKVEFSVQQIIDCSYEYFNCGCHGGYLYASYLYIKDHGILLENEYPFEGFGKICTANPKKKSEIDIKNFKIFGKNETILQYALLKFGPVGSAMNTAAWQHYRNGIFDSNTCSERADHAVTIFGFGVERNTEYWIMKNSWGKHWGENGYARFVRNKNLCGFGKYATVPIL